MKNFSQITELTAEKILGLIKTGASKMSSGNLELGKLLVALDIKRDGVGTLKSYVRKTAEIEVPDHAFCCAVAFRATVSAEILEETIYDATPLKWLLQVSAIVNAMEKAEIEDSGRAVVMHEVCEILRNRPDGAEGLLKAIKDRIRGNVGAGENAPGSGEPGDPETPDITPDLLSMANLQALGKAVFECSDIAKLETAAKAFRSILEIAEARIEETRVAA